VPAGPRATSSTSGLESVLVDGLPRAALGMIGLLVSSPSGSRPPGRVFIVALCVRCRLQRAGTPRLALIGGGALIMMLIAYRRAAPVEIVVAGGFVAGGLPIFANGLLTAAVSRTALAKTRRRQMVAGPDLTVELPP